MEFVTKERFPATSRTKALLEATGKEGEGNTLLWDIIGDENLALEEMKALRRKHKTRAVNYARASDVKRLMLQGKRCVDVVFLLRKKYCERMIKADHAALAPLLGRGGAKKRR